MAVPNRILLTDDEFVERLRAVEWDRYALAAELHVSYSAVTKRLTVMNATIPKGPRVTGRFVHRQQEKAIEQLKNLEKTVKDLEKTARYTSRLLEMQFKLLETQSKAIETLTKRVETLEKSPKQAQISHRRLKDGGEHVKDQLKRRRTLNVADIA